MSVIEELVSAEREWAANFALETLSHTPRRKLAVVACMDCRLTVEQILGLAVGDAHVIRNAGGIITDDVLRSLIVSHHMLGTEEFMVINHTDCGMMSFEDDDLRAKLRTMTGVATSVQFHTFTDLHANVARQIQILREHPWVPDEIIVRGFVYDVRTGRLHEVEAKTAAENENEALPPLAPLPPLAGL